MFFGVTEGRRHNLAEDRGAAGAILVLDVDRFNREDWTDSERTGIRSALENVVREAIEQLGEDDSCAECHDTGDGLLILFAADFEKRQIVRDLHAKVEDGVLRANFERDESRRFRLRGPFTTESTFEIRSNRKTQVRREGQSTKHFVWLTRT